MISNLQIQIIEVNCKKMPNIDYSGRIAAVVQASIRWTRNKETWILNLMNLTRVF